MKIHSTRLLLSTLKRNLKKPAMLLMLAVFPLLALFLREGGTNEDSICAAVYIESLEEDSFVSQAFDSALTDYAGEIEFVHCPSEEAVQDMVVKREAECGYVIPYDLFTRLLEGEAEEAVKVYYAPSSALMPLASEALYALLFSEISKEAVTQYLLDTCAIHEQISSAYTAEEIGTLYDTILSSGTTFHFQQEQLSELSRTEPETALANETASLARTSLRGILSVFLLLASLLGLLDYLRCAYAPIFCRPGVRLLLILAPSLLAAADAFLCICISDYGLPLWKEALILCLYWFCCVLFSFLLGFLVRRSAWLTAFLPLYLLSNLIFCPIFADLGSLLPLLRILSYFFLPTHYLNMFS